MKYDYETISEFGNLYKAHQMSRKGKSHKPEVIKFEGNLSYELCRMKHQLENHTYRFSGYYHFTIHEPKKREIYAAYYRDRVMQHCVCDEILLPLLTPRLIHDNAACQKGKGVHFAQKRMSKFLREHYQKYGRDGYALKCDIHHYFPSINHAVLKEKVMKVVKDEDVQDLLFQFVDSYHEESNPGTGLALGNQTNQWFAIFYLDSLDRLVKERLRIKHYTRYMDDFILIHPDKKYLQYCLEQIEEHVRTLKLELNKKTQVVPLKNGIEYVGFRFHLTANGKVVRKMKRASKVRLKRKLATLQKDYANGKIDLARVKQSLAGFKGHLKHGHTYHLRKTVFEKFVLQRDTGVM